MQSNSSTIARPRISTILCDYFGFILINYCLVTNPQQQQLSELQTERIPEHFRLEYEWSHVNFTWPSDSAYEEAVRTKKYIPQNNAIVGVKFYKDKMYLALSRLRPGSPTTLATLLTQKKDKSKVKQNVWLTPFPSWRMNILPQEESDCKSTLVNVHGLEIDRRGILWALDGNRYLDHENALRLCPPKLVLLDLNKAGSILQTYTFPDHICLKNGGFLNDLVVDEDDGGYAYITDSSVIDPGLIVFSRRQGRAWKVRDKSMYPDLETGSFHVGTFKMSSLTPIDGIAMSPVPPRRDEDRVVYYSALNSHHIYALSNKVLRNERFCKGDQWRRYVKYAGRKNSIGDGMIVDNKGDMFYGLIGKYKVAKWNIYEPFNANESIPLDKEEINIWPTGFAIDSVGYLYLLVNSMHKFYDRKYMPNFEMNSNSSKFKIFKMYIGHNNYMYTNK